MTKRKDNEDAVITKIAEAAQELGMDAYLVGGYVRDMLLKQAEKGRDIENKDIDVVCVGSGIQLAEATARKFNPLPKVSVFKNFGTAMFRIKDIELEFVGARKESYQRDSRKPIVENGSLRDDQLRRDFTINAMAISLNPENYGELIDPFNGMRDLKAKRIKTPLDPDLTFSDDPLRMMRAIRFATQLHFNIDPVTLSAIVRNRHRMEIVSRERISDELNKIIMSEKPSIGFKLLLEAGLLDLIFPEMAHLYGVDVIRGKGHKDNFYHTLKVLDNTAAKSKNLWLRWAAVLHDIAKPATKRFNDKEGWTFHGHDAMGAQMVPQIFRKLKLPLNEKMKFVQKMVLLHLRPISLARENVSDSAVRRLLFEAGDDIDELMTLCEADITSANMARVKKYMKNFELVRQKLKDVEEKDQLRNWQPPVTGDMIMKTFGLKPSRMVGEIKEELKEAILDGKISNDFEEAYAYLLKKGRELGLDVKKDLRK